MKTSHAIVAIASVGIAVLTGCAGKNPVSSHNETTSYALVSSYEDASSQDIANDVAGMSESFGIGNKSNTLAKKTADGTGSIQWQNWTYGSSWWYRGGSISYTSTDGAILLEGSDSVQFLDASSAAVQHPLLADLSGGAARHHGSMSLTGANGGYVDATRDWALTASLVKATDTTLTLNGTLTQTFAAENAAKTASCNFQGQATATNVVYNKSGDGWSKPVSGSVSVVSPYKTIAITFSNGTAHILVTAKDGTVTKDVTVTL